MSGIAGIIYLDGRSADRFDLGRMVDAMAHRGPDGRAVWCEGSVGLGHCMLHTTPESLHEVLPYTSASGVHTITADARIDNREELLSVLRVSGPAHLVSDSELILRAYERWGEACVDHLVGDFAFAIWDAAEQKLFCARDHFGIKPFYYYFVPNQCFVFGSEIKAVLQHPEVVEELDEVQFGLHLTRVPADTVRTVFKNVVRLRPAHAFRLAAGTAEERRYWTLSPAPVDQNLTDEEYTARFLELFTEAVRCRLRSAYPIASELSGGMDSSAVTCMARDLLQAQSGPPLHSISLVYNRFTDCDERPFIQEVLKQGGIEPHFTAADEESLFDILEEVFRYLDEGRASGNHYLNWLTARTAGRTGSRVLLSGQDGDTTVSHGWFYFLEMAREGRWEEFAREAQLCVEHLRAEQSLYRTQEAYRSTADIVNAYAVKYLQECASDRKRWRFFRSVNAMKKHLPVSPRAVYRRFWRQLLIPGFVQRRRALSASRGMEAHLPGHINRAFATRIQLQERLAQFRASEPKRPTVRGDQLSTLQSAYLDFSFEKFDLYAAANGVEARHPFMDKRLIEFCLALPSRQSLSGGWTRVILRRAMQGILPEALQWRAAKALLGGSYKHVLFGAKPGAVEALMQDLDMLVPYVDLDHVRQLYERRNMLSDAEEVTFGLILTMVYWLKRRYERAGQIPLKKAA